MKLDKGFFKELVHTYDGRLLLLTYGIGYMLILGIIRIAVVQLNIPLPGWIQPVSAVLVVVLIVASTLQYFTVNVPEVTVLIGVNVLHKGEFVYFEPGLHPRRPWLQIKDINYLDMQIVKLDINEDYAAKDGPLMVVKGQIQYRPDVKYLNAYRSVNEEDIQGALRGIASNFLSAYIAKKPSDTVRKNIQEIRDRLRERFNEPVEVNGGDTSELDQRYGIEFVASFISDIDYETSVQEARAAKRESEIVEQAAQALMKVDESLYDKNEPTVKARIRNKMRTGKLSEEDAYNAIVADVMEQYGNIKRKDAMNSVLILRKRITKNVIEVEGEGGNALAGLLTQIGTGRSQK